MEDHDIFLQDALKRLKTADFVLSQTYNIVKDKKLLITIMENLQKALENSINALLYYEKQKKGINVIPSSFEAKIDVFKGLILKYKLERNMITDIKNLQGIVETHKKSAMEFQKDQKMVIMEDSMKIKAFGFEDTKRLLDNSKRYITKIEDIITGKK